MKKDKFLQKYGICIVLVVLILFFSIIAPAFLSISNMMNIARQVSMTGIAAVGMMFVMLTGGIDLSIGSVFSFVNVFCAYLMVEHGWNPFLAAAVCILIASFGGGINGIIITKLRVPPLISTMALMNIWSGITFLISKGMPIFGLPKGFSVIGQSYLGPIPIPVLFMALFIGLGAFILSKTYFGRYFYAIGGNEEASMLSGINVPKIKMLVYVLCATFSAIAGIIMLSRLGSGQATTGDGFEFQVITAVVLGGVSVAGGSGRISGVVVGVLIMGILSNGLILVNASEYIQRIIQGLVLISAVGFDCVSKYRVSVVKKVKKAKEA